jgi:dUTP pyrophosphatase
MRKEDCYNCGCNLKEVCPDYDGQGDEMLVKYTKVHESAKVPRRAYATDAGMDFFYCGEDQIRIDLACSAVIPTGIKMEVPSGYMLEIKNKSGVASKRNLIVGACVVDTGYDGEIFVNLHNVGLKSQTIDPGEKVAQGVFVKIADHVSLVEAESIYAEPTERADGALGSTGDQ